MERKRARVHDGDLAGVYVKGTSGPPSVTRIVDGMTTYYQTGPDEWVATAEGGGSNPLLEFRQGAETACVFDGNGTIVVALGSATTVRFDVGHPVRGHARQRRPRGIDRLR